MTPSEFIAYFEQLASENKQIAYHADTNKSFVRGTINEYLDNLIDFEGDGPWFFLEMKTGAFDDQGDNPFDITDFAFMILIKVEPEDPHDMEVKLDLAFTIGRQFCSRIRKDAITFHDGYDTMGDDSLFQSFDFSSVRYIKVGAKGDNEHGYRFSGKLPAAIDLQYNEDEWEVESTEESEEVAPPYVPIRGCRNPLAVNFDENAEIDDGSCRFLIPPVADAGVNQIITLPTSQVTLDGSNSSDDGTIVSYFWEQIAGGACTITDPSSAITTVTGLSAGVFIFQLTVTDDDGLVNTDAGIAITVNAPNELPIADAGANQSITLPTDNVSLDGTASSDPDGSIVSYLWTQISGGAATITTPDADTTTVTGLEAGTYVFQLTVTDDAGDSSSDTVTIIVNAIAPVGIPPVSHAGVNQNITLPTNSVSVNGSTSSDSDGTIVSYLWTKISGGAATITTPAAVGTTITGLVAGTYIFKLLVTDNDGLTDADTVTIKVHPVPNQPPIADAGINQTISLPTSSVSLDGGGSTDPDGTISSYVWSQVSGGACTITTPNSATTSVTGLAEGVYVFQLLITDNGGLTSYDAVTITVNATPAGGDVVFDMAGIKTIETQFGFNIIRSDLSANKVAAWEARTVELAPQMLYLFDFNDPVGLMNATYAARLNTLLAACGNIPLGVYLALQYEEVDPIELLEFYKSMYGNIAFVADDQETLTITHGSGVTFMNTNPKYIARCQLMYDHDSSQEYCWDGGLIDHYPHADHIARNEAIAASSLPFILTRQYQQMGDITSWSSTDQVLNMVKMGDYLVVKLPGYLATFKDVLPGKKAVLLQELEHDAGQPEPSEVIMNLACAGRHIHVLSNTEMYPYMIRMRLANMFDHFNNPEPEFYANKRVIKGYKFPYVIPVSIPFSGCTALGFWDGEDSWGIHIRNESADDQIITPAQLNIPLKVISGNFLSDRGWGDTISSLLQNEENVSEANITVKKYGNVFATFSTVPSPGTPAVTHTVLPQVTDPDITLAIDQPHFAYVPAVPSNKLLLFLHGSGARPSGYELFMETAQEEGSYVLAPYYYNPYPRADQCALATEPTDQYLDLYNRELLFGVDLSPLTAINYANCIENRVIKLLEYLIDTYPSEGWDQFLILGEVQWDLITVAGHSQGAGLAASLGKYKDLGGGVIMFSGPSELCQYITSWGSFLTDLAKYRVFNHNLDSYAKRLVTWANIPIPGVPVDMEIEPDENEWGQLLITSKTEGMGNNYHLGILTDATTPIMEDGTAYFKEVWRNRLNYLI